MCVITRAPNSCFNVNDSCFLCHTHRKPLRVSAFSPENKKADTTSKWISQEETLLGKASAGNTCWDNVIGCIIVLGLAYCAEAHYLEYAPLPTLNLLLLNPTNLSVVSLHL